MIFTYIYLVYLVFSFLFSWYLWAGEAGIGRDICPAQVCSVHLCLEHWTTRVTREIVHSGVFSVLRCNKTGYEWLWYNIILHINSYYILLHYIPSFADPQKLAKKLRFLGQALALISAAPRDVQDRLVEKRAKSLIMENTEVRRGSMIRRSL